MNSVSAARKLAQQVWGPQRARCWRAGVEAARLVRTGQSGVWVRALLAGLAAAFASFGRALHALWLEIAGLFFIVFAVVGTSAAVREYRAYAAGKVGPGRTLMAATFALTFAYFGVTSFWRARRRA